MDSRRESPVFLRLESHYSLCSLMLTPAVFFSWPNADGYSQPGRAWFRSMTCSDPLVDFPVDHFSGFS